MTKNSALRIKTTQNIKGNFSTLDNEALSRTILASAYYSSVKSKRNRKQPVKPLWEGNSTAFFLNLLSKIILVSINTIKHVQTFVTSKWFEISLAKKCNLYPCESWYFRKLALFSQTARFISITLQCCKDL